MQVTQAVGGIRTLIEKRLGHCYSSSVLEFASPANSKPIDAYFNVKSAIFLFEDWHTNFRLNRRRAIIKSINPIRKFAYLSR